MEKEIKRYHIWKQSHKAIFSLLGSCKDVKQENEEGAVWFPSEGGSQAVLTGGEKGSWHLGRSANLNALTSIAERHWGKCFAPFRCPGTALCQG